MEPSDLIVPGNDRKRNPLESKRLRTGYVWACGLGGLLNVG